MSNKLTHTRYGMMLYPESDLGIGRNLALYGEWYQSEMDWMAPYIPKGGICIDAGANIGCHTLFFARTVGPDGFVVSFEPQRILFQILCANLALNDLYQVQAFNAALGEKGGVSFMPLLDYNRPGNFGAVDSRSRQGEEVALLSLDSLRFHRIDLLKIDVEGAEPQIILGAQTTLCKHRPYLYIEYHPEAHSLGLIELLHALEYEVHEHLAPGYNPANLKGEQTNIHENFRERNLFCTPVEKELCVPLPPFQKLSFRKSEDLFNERL